MYRIYADTVRKKLNLGHKGENEARCVIFDLNSLKEEFGDGTWNIVNQRCGDTVPYLVTNTRALENNAIWTLTNVDTDKCGEGRCELRYKVNDVLVKTDVYATTVLPSLGDTGEAPSPSEDLINKMSEIKEETEASATAAASSESKASEYMADAKASKEAAEASKTAANSYAANAEASKTAAASSASNASASATQAAAYKDEAFSVTPEGYEDVAKYATQGVITDDDGLFYALVEG